LKGVGVVVALAAEARALGPSRSQQQDSLSRLSDGSLLELSGMGGLAAAAAAQRLIKAQVSALMTFGMAGGLDPTLQAGGIVLPALVIAENGGRFATCASWRARVSAALYARQLSEGALFSSVRAIDTPSEKAELFRATGAVAVDMESGAVAQVAAAHQLPFIAVRVIVDTAADALPLTVIGASRGGHVRIARLIGGLIMAPGEIGSLLRLARRYHAAMRSLRVIAPLLA
jgi:adenosylhomocysteine nucleosidase